MELCDDDDDFVSGSNHAQREWDKLAENYTNDGYREGITAGKEGALQEGFDDGFARIGVPLGQKIGSLRGLAAGMIAFLRGQATGGQDARAQETLAEVQSISDELNRISFSTIVPPDLQAEEHAATHSQEGDDTPSGAQLDSLDGITMAMEGLASDNSLQARERRRADVMANLSVLEGRLGTVLESLGFSKDLGS